jgi:hypothetical protein
MPDQVEPVGQAPVAETPPAKPARKPKVSPLEKLKQKYRLDDTVRILEAGPDGRPLGSGPLLDPEVFNRFAALDPSKDKRYLDWMLFQVGGGVAAFKRSMEQWGVDIPEVQPDDLIRRFNTEITNRLSTVDLNEIARSTGIPQLPRLSAEISQAMTPRDPVASYQSLLALLQQRQLRPGKEEKLAMELVSHKLKKWIKDQSDVRVRDRVHIMTVWSRTLRGMTREQAEAEWQRIMPTRMREYMLGDQDSSKRTLFGFNRHWPGRESRYETVHDEMKTFLQNAERVKRRNDQLEKYNAQIAIKNAQLPPERQLPLREPIEVDLNIGKVTLDEKNMVLSYRGPYPTVQELSKANEAISEMPLRDRVRADVRYAGPQGKEGPGEKLYSDENLDVFVPLTMAASVQSGHPGWEISDPAQYQSIKAKSQGHSMTAWTANYSGLDVVGDEGGGGRDYMRVPIIFHLKRAVKPEFSRLLLATPIDELVELSPPYLGLKFRMGETREVILKDLVQQMKSTLPRDVYLSTLRSVRDAIRFIQKWAGGFDPGRVVADPTAYHLRRMGGPARSFKEEIELRARQTMNLLIA